MALDLISNNTDKDLSAVDIRALSEWPTPLIEDYLNKSDLINALLNVTNDDLGTMALQDADNVTITGGGIAGVSLNASSVITASLTATTASIGTVTITDATITDLSVTNLTLSSLTLDDLIVNGDVQLGNAPGDSLILWSNTVQWLGNPTHSGNHQFNGTVSLNSKLKLLQSTGNYTINWDDPAADRALTVPDPGQDDTFLFMSIAAARAAQHI